MNQGRFMASSSATTVSGPIAQNTSSGNLAASFFSSLTLLGLLNHYDWADVFLDVLYPVHKSPGNLSREHILLVLRWPLTQQRVGLAQDGGSQLDDLFDILEILGIRLV